MGILDKLFKRSENSQTTTDKNIEPGIQSKKLFLDNREIEDIIEIIALNDILLDSLGDKLFDTLLIDAAKLIVQHQQGSTSLVQRTFSIGYNRSGRIIDQLEMLGIIGPFDGSNARDVNIQSISQLEKYLKTDFFSINKMEFVFENYKERINRRRIDYHNQQELEKERLEKEVIKSQLIEKERKNRLEKEALQELIDEGKLFNSFTNNNETREPIPQDVMDKVWNRDGGKCVKCGSQENLEFDHIIPVSKGGATTYRNLQLLCKKCNLEKSNNIG